MQVISQSVIKLITIILSFLIAALYSVANASPLQQSRTLPAISCGENGLYCEIRLSQENDLYIYASNDSPQSRVLYVSRHNQQTYTQYDLSPYSAWLQGLPIDFVPFSEHDAVLFFSQSTAKLIRLDLVTGEVTEFTQTGDTGRLIACNNWGTYRGGYRLISRLGTGSQFIFCSLNEAHTKVLINVGDIAAYTTLHSYDFNFLWTGPGNLFWNTLIGGDDGNIYIHVSGKDSRQIWQEIAGAPLPQLNFSGWRLFRFEPSINAWSLRNITPEDMESDNFPFEDMIVDISRLAAVMQNGDVIYHHQSQNINSPSPLNEMLEISRYNANFELLARTEIEETENLQLNFVGISRDGNFLVLDPVRLAQSIEMRLNISPNANTGTEQTVEDEVVITVQAPTNTPIFTPSN